MKPRNHPDEPPALTLLEEAVALLRQQPIPALAAYYVGAVPFVLAGLFFWADMSRAARADERLVGGALTVAVAFLWMKVSQFAFLRRLRRHLTADPFEPIPWKTWWREASRQVLFQPWRLILIPLATFLMFPLPWVLAFFENLTVLGSTPSENQPGSTLIRRAWRQARLWPAQNLALTALLTLVALVLWANLVLLLVQTPQLLKSLFGLDTIFSRSAWAYLNTTFLAASATLTFLAIDPLVKTVYLLRCYYGESRRTGEDLRVGFRQLQARASTARRATQVLVALLLISLYTLSPAFAAYAASPPITQESQDDVTAVDGSAALHQAIEEVMRRPIYEWRLPRRETLEDQERHQSSLRKWFEQWLNDLKALLRDILGRLNNLLRGFGDFLENLGRRLFGRGWQPPTPGGSIDLAGGLQLLFWAAVTLAIIGSLAWAIRHFLPQRRPIAPDPTPSTEVTWSMDEAAAARRPADEWVQLAEDCLERGEPRLALRALYLGALARLAQAGCLSLAVHKSNREYENELTRRTRNQPEVSATFSQLRHWVEPVWYGRHIPSTQTIHDARASLDKLRDWIAARSPTGPLPPAIQPVVQRTTKSGTTPTGDSSDT